MHNSDAQASGLGRRERKKRETRRTIRSAALDLALQVGMDKLTVEAITEAADVAPRTFFNYFSSKEDALVTDVTTVAASVQPLIVGRPATETPLRAFRMVITEEDPFSFMQVNRERELARQKFIQQHPSLMGRQLAQYSHLEAAFAEAFAQRLNVDPERDLRPALLATVAIGVLRVAIKRWTVDVDQSFSDLLSFAFDLVEQDLP